MTRFYPLLCLLLAGLPAAAVAQTISCFSPAVGNVGTLVTLGGTDLDRVTAVAVGGVAAVVLDQTRTVLHLLVLPGAASGPITTTGGAPATSAASFTVTRTALNAVQQGPRLVGTGAVGLAHQGYSVALSADGTTLAVGGHEDNSSLGPNGFGGSGAAWVFTRSSTGWVQQGPKLVGAGAVGSAGQGYSVALSADGSILAVGGPGDNGNRGAAWVFTRSGTSWGQQGSKLVGAGATAGFASQGWSVALSADGATLAVGGYNDDRNGGATWVFTRSGTSWGQQGPKLVGTGAAGSASQGASVALSADGATLAVGGRTDSNFDGAVWVFTRSGTGWVQQGPKLVGAGAVGTRVLQGWSVALSADGATLAVGGPSDNNLYGAAWVFTRSGTGWVQQGPKLVGAGAVGLAHQGYSVALSADGTTLAMGGYGDGNSSGYTGSGAAWVFTRSGTSWGQQDPKLVGTGAVGSAGQGGSVALSADGATLAVGGPGDDNGAGATWVFSAARSLGVACLPPDAGAFPPPPVAAPNIITPNGDGLNDVFRLPGLPPGPWQLRIYSRWGQQVFASGDYQQDWSAPGLADGLYYYWLQSPARPSLRGWLEVIH